MQTHARFLAALFASLALSCAPTLEADGYASHAQAIYNGVDDDQSTEVVGLRVQEAPGSDGGRCSGAMIAPQIVLTAAHCVVGAPAGTRFLVTARAAPPYADEDFVEAEEWTALEYGGFVNDLALLRLAAAPPGGGRLARVTRTPLSADDLGAMIHAVGYGKLSPEDATLAQRRATDVPLVAFDAEALYTDEQDSGTCYGDSGGPRFLDRGRGLELVGVTSQTVRSCTAGGIATRTDVALAEFIEPWVAERVEATCATGDWCKADCELLDADCPEGGRCGAEGTCEPGCFVPDPDCATGLAGDPCETGEQCTSGMCVSVDGAAACADPCGDGCAEGLACLSTEQGDEVCVPAPPTCGSSAPTSLGALALLLLWRPGRRRAWFAARAQPAELPGDGGERTVANAAARRSWSCIEL